MAGSAKSRWRGWAIRAGGSVLILGLLAWFLPVGDIAGAAARLSLVTFLWVWAAFVFGHAVAAAKWRALVGSALGYGAALRAHVAGLAANLCLPGAAGGDVVRAGAAQLAIRDGAKVISGSLADRLVDMLALAILALAGVVALSGGGQWGALALQVALFMAAALAGALWLIPSLVPWLWDRLAFLPARKLALKTASEFKALARRPGLLALALAVSTAIQALFVWLAMQLGLAIGIVLAPAVWFLAWPLAKLLAVLPVSLNGLGLREATLAGLMVPFGADAARVVAAGLIWQAVLYLTGAIGALVLVASGFRLWPDPNEPVTE